MKIINKENNEIIAIIDEEIIRIICPSKYELVVDSEKQEEKFINA